MSSTPAKRGVQAASSSEGTKARSNPGVGQAGGSASRRGRGGKRGGAGVGFVLSTANPDPQRHWVIGMASGQAVAGVNVVKDIFGSVTNFVGGFSETYENSIAKARERAIEMMVSSARSNAQVTGIHAIQFQFGTIVDKMIVITASGTMVGDY